MKWEYVSREMGKTVKTLDKMGINEMGIDEREINLDSVDSDLILMININHINCI